MSSASQQSRSAAQFLYSASPASGRTRRGSGSRFSRQGDDWAAALVNRREATQSSASAAANASSAAALSTRSDIKKRDTLRAEALHRVTKGNLRGAVTSAIESIRIMEGELNALGEMLPECMVLTRAYFKLGDSSEARFYLNRCAKLVQTEPYEDPATNAALYSMLAELYMLDSEFHRAKRLYGIYLRKMEHTFGKNHLAMSDCYNVIAAFFTTQGDYGTALEYCTKSLVIRMEQLGLNHRHTADSHFNMGLLYRLYGRPLDARREFSIARDIRKTMFGLESLEIAEVELSLGFTEHQLGDLTAARGLCERAYASRRQLLGRRHPDSIEALNLLNAVRVAQGAPKVDPNNFSPPIFEKASGRSDAWEEVESSNVKTKVFDVYVIERVTARLARQQRVTAGFATRLVQAAKDAGALSGDDIRNRFIARYPIETANVLSELHDSWVEAKHSFGRPMGQRSHHPSSRLGTARAEQGFGLQPNGKPMPYPISPLQAQRKKPAKQDSRSDKKVEETHSVSTIQASGTGSGTGTLSWMDTMTKKERELLAAENARLGYGGGFGGPNTGGGNAGAGVGPQSPSSPSGYIFASGYFENHPLAGDAAVGGPIGVGKRGGQGTGSGRYGFGIAAAFDGSGDGLGGTSGFGSHGSELDAEFGGRGSGSGAKAGDGDKNEGPGLGSNVGAASSGPGSGTGYGSSFDHFADQNALTLDGRRTKTVALSGEELLNSCHIPIFCCLGLFPMLLEKKRALDRAEQARTAAAADKTVPDAAEGAGAAAALSKAKPSSPKPKSPKKDLGPKSDTKRVHWDVLESTEGTIWDSGVESDVDFGDLLTEFSTKQKAKSEKEEAPKSKRQEIVLVPDPKRRQNMSIFAKTLMKGGKDLAEIGIALRRMDTVRLDGSAIESLKEFLPQGDEADAVGSYLDGGGDAALLGPAEKFVHALAEIPRLNQRIQALGIMSTFDESAQEVDKRAQVLLDMCGDLKRSERFVKLLQIILKVGNDLNKGTHKGGASGVRLSSLVKLAQTKSNNNTTLLEYLVNNLQEKQPEILEVVDDFPQVAEARRCNMQILSADSMKLTSGLTMVRNANTAAGAAGDDEDFTNATDSFLVRAQAVNEKTQKLFSSAKDEYADVAKYVGEDAKVMAPEELFEHLHGFITLLNSTVRKCREIRERKERSERHQKAKQERSARIDEGKK